MSAKDSNLNSNGTLILSEPFNRIEDNANRSNNFYFEFECRSCDRIWQYGYPTLLALGLVGNVLYLVAFTAHKFRRETQLLCSLKAVLDSLSLVAAFVSRWPDAMFKINTMILYPGLCHVLITANYWLPEFAAWALVYLTIERFLSVHYAMGYWWLTRYRYCVLICCSMGLVLLLLNIYFIFIPLADKSVIQENESKYEYNLSLITTNEFEMESSYKEMLENTRILINLTDDTASTPNQFEAETQKNLVGTYQKVGERSECEAALEKSHWIVWNLIDLALSSLGPFLIIFAINIAIIIAISTHNRHVARQRPIVLSDNERVSRTLEEGPQLEQGLFHSGDQAKRAKMASDANAEKAVTRMLLLTTLTFVVLCTPIVAGHSLQMLLTEDTLFSLMEPATCMTVFAVAEMLSFGQHAVQFYVYLTCSARFRQALLRQLDSLIHRLGSLRFHHVTHAHRLPSPYPETNHSIPLGFLSPTSPWHVPAQYDLVRPCSTTQNSTQCHHAFVWIDPHILMCRLCLHERVVHHPSCHNFRDEQRFECECLLSSIEHPAHLVVHLGDQQSPFFGL